MLWLLGGERRGRDREPLRLQVSRDPARYLGALQSGNPERLVVRWAAGVSDEVRAERVRAEAERALAARGAAMRVRGGWIVAAEADVVLAIEAAAAGEGVVLRVLGEVER